MNVHLLIFAVLLVTVVAAPTEEEKKFVENILQNVPTEARRRFIKEQLFAGYLKTQSLGGKVLFRPREEKYNFAAHYEGVKWVLWTEEYKLEDEAAIQLYNIFIRNCPKIRPRSGTLRERICLPNGHCFDPEDSGIYP